MGVGANCFTEGELLDLIDEFSDGRIQFAFVKVKDPNTTLPKCVLIAWVRISSFSHDIELLVNLSAVR